MDDYLTVFEIKPGPSEIQLDIYQRLAIGFIVLAVAIISIILYATRHKTNKWKPKLYTVIFLPLWSIGWLCFTIPWFSSANSELNNLLSAYQNGDYTVTQGPVTVLRTQPEHGHAPGDLVSVGDTEFEFSYFVSTHAYHKTIAHGGHLREGVYAKVFHRNRKILRIDIEKNNTPIEK